MTGGGPIRRRAGSRRRDKASSEAQAVAEAAASPKPEPAPKRAPATPPPRRARVMGSGRRVFDPRAEREGGTEGAKPYIAGRTMGARSDKGRAAAAKPEKKTSRPSELAVDSEKLRERNEAQALAQEKGIPPVHALRVIRGQATLNEVLKGLMHKDRIDRLVRNDGIDRGLAGQVAAGQLAKERALVITRIRKHRPQRLDRDALKVAELAAEPVALSRFGKGWVVGTIRNARTYDFDFVPGDGGPQETVFKHDVKAVGSPETADGATSFDPDIQAAGLGSTAERGDRVKPDDVTVLQLVEAETPVVLHTRDGERFEGVLTAFGRWDATMALANDVQVTVLFHALHGSCATLLQAE